MKKVFYIESIERHGDFPPFNSTKIEGRVIDDGGFFKQILNKKLNEYLVICTEDELREFTNPNYETLARILKMAYEQASGGKGKERHANGKSFDDQPIMTITRNKGLGFPTGQAEKKLGEACTLLKLKGKDAAIRELLGVINYTAAAIAHIENMEKGEMK